MQIVPSDPSGQPIDIKWLDYHRFHNGQELIVFDSFSEYANYFNLIPKDDGIDPNSEITDSNP
jgi:hypothetical protein